VPYTPEQALAYARTVGGALGFTEAQLPTSQMHNVLNALEECQAIIESYEQARTPLPLTQVVPVPVAERTPRTGR